MATLQELETLFSQQTETLAIEFKAWLDMSNPQGRAVLAKAAIALANHGEGTIVMGMREAANKPVGSYPRPQEIRRYTADAVNVAVNKYADPHIHCDVVHLNHPVTGHEHAFVVVPGGQTVPVMSVKDADGIIMSQRVYIRKPGPKSEEPFNSEEWRPLLNRCVNNGRDEMLDRIRVIISGSALSPVTSLDKLMGFIDASRAWFAQVINPLPEKAGERHWIGSYEFAFQLHDVPKVTLPELSRLLERASAVKHTGWGPFVNLTRPPIAPVPAHGAIEAWLGNPTDGVNDPSHADFWRASPEGSLYQIRGYDEDYMRGVVPGRVIDITMPIWRLGEAMLYIARLGMEWAGDPRITIWAEYSGLEGRILGTYTGTRNPMNKRTSRTPNVILQGEA